MVSVGRFELQFRFLYPKDAVLIVSGRTKDGDIPVIALTGQCAIVPVVDDAMYKITVFSIAVGADIVARSIKTTNGAVADVQIGVIVRTTEDGNTTAFNPRSAIFPPWPHFNFLGVAAPDANLVRLYVNEIDIHSLNNGVVCTNMKHSE